MHYASTAGLKRAEAYGASLKAWITRMRADLAEYHPCLPVVLPLMSIMGRWAALECCQDRWLHLD